MKCDHPGCNCSGSEIRREGHHYCSEACAAQGAEAAPGGCRCGHPDCG